MNAFKKKKTNCANKNSFDKKKRSTLRSNLGFLNFWIHKNRKKKTKTKKKKKKTKNNNKKNNNKKIESPLQPTTQQDEMLNPGQAERWRVCVTTIAIECEHLDQRRSIAEERILEQDRCFSVKATQES